MTGVKNILLIRLNLNEVDICQHYYDESCNNIDSTGDILQKNENENDTHLDANGNDSIRWESVGFDL